MSLLFFIVTDGWMGPKMVLYFSETLRTESTLNFFFSFVGFDMKTLQMGLKIGFEFESFENFVRIHNK